MLNQAAVEALYSATYIENYLDYVENVPDELQRYVSRVRELDLTYVGFLKEIEQHCESLVHDVESISQKKSYLSKVQQALICAQELGDEKLQVMQQLQDIIENKTRQLDIDYRNLADIGKDGDGIETSRDMSRESSTFALLNNGGAGGERASKRVRRTRTDLVQQRDQSPSMDIVSTPEPSKQTQQTSQPSTPSSAVSTAPKKLNSASLGKKKKRKSKNNQQSSQKESQTSRDSQKDRDESPTRDDEMLIDPDEPTYCLCDQISYGEMICCDNDLCPYEWFHFSCVSLGAKPKGKWYCPKCRGDRSSVMKPKAQLMKELERLKQEKETKEEKGS